jgi:hypothetical protein
MIEGCPPFSAEENNEVSKAIASKERPPFTALKNYSYGLKEYAFLFLLVLWNSHV